MVDKDGVAAEGLCWPHNGIKELKSFVHCIQTKELPSAVHGVGANGLSSGLSSPCRLGGPLSPLSVSTFQTG